MTGTRTEDLWTRRPEHPAIVGLQGWTSRPALGAAHGLAIAGRSLSDVEPLILVWLHALDDAHVETIGLALIRAITDAAGRARMRVKPEAIAQAVFDAMRKVRHTRGQKCAGLVASAKRVRTRVERYAQLRDAAEELLLRAIRDGQDRYLRACGFGRKSPRTEAGPETGNQETPKSVRWSHGHEESERGAPDRSP